MTSCTANNDEPKSILLRQTTFNTGKDSSKLAYCCCCTGAFYLSDYPDLQCNACNLHNIHLCVTCKEHRPDLDPPTTCYRCIDRSNLVGKQTKKRKLDKLRELHKEGLCPCGFGGKGVCKKQNENFGREFISCKYCDYFRWVKERDDVEKKDALYRQSFRIDPDAE